MDDLIPPGTLTPCLWERFPPPRGGLSLSKDRFFHIPLNLPPTRQNSSSPLLDIPSQCVLLVLRHGCIPAQRVWTWAASTFLNLLPRGSGDLFLFDFFCSPGQWDCSTPNCIFLGGMRQRQHATWGRSWPLDSKSLVLVPWMRREKCLNSWPGQWAEQGGAGSATSGDQGVAVVGSRSLLPDSPLALPR